MMQSFFRRFVLGRIEEAGRHLGAPVVIFSNRKISVSGEDITIADGLLRLITNTSGFYLPLPANAFGVVVFPDGNSHNMDGGIHEAPPGRYKLQYVDKHERSDLTMPINEITPDGEKLTLKVLFRYRVIDPVEALDIERPIETFVEHIETDVAQYIRTHDHTDIADSAENILGSQLLSFFLQRHYKRPQFSKAFSLTGVELKDFTGDNELVQQRRKARIEKIQVGIDKEQTADQQELNVLKARYKADNEKRDAEHRAELEKRNAEHTAELKKKAAEHRTEIEKIEAEHEKEKQEILEQVRLRELELEGKREQMRLKGQEFSQIAAMISGAFSSGNPVNPGVIKQIADLFADYREELIKEIQAPLTSVSRPVGSEDTPPQTSSTPVQSTASDKAEKLKNTILNLLKPK